MIDSFICFSKENLRSDEFTKDGMEPSLPSNESGFLRVLDGLLLLLSGAT